MKPIHEVDIKGIKYEGDEYSEVLNKAREIFDITFCKISNVEKPYISCLDRIEHDGTDKDGIEYAVGMYCLGGMKDDCPIIYLISDGYRSYWGTEADKDYNDTIKKSRLFHEEPYIETLDGKYYIPEGE